MVGATKAAGLAICMTISYWLYFFGAELVSTIQLYQRGNNIYRFIISKPLPQNPTSTARTHVPLIMHRMWRDDGIIENNNAEVPLNWTKAFNFCNEKYRQKGWTTILWTDESIRVFLETHYPNFLSVYDSYPYNIQRVDAARYFILYHYGGLYMDLDVGCQKHMDLGDLIASMEYSGKGAMFPLTKPFGLSNDVMFATKESPFFQKLIDSLVAKNRWYGSPYLTVMYSTGPMFLSARYMEFSSKQNNDVVVLPQELYTKKGTRFFKHLRGSTWHSTDAQVAKWLIYNLPAAAAIGILLAVLFRKFGHLHLPRKTANKRV